MLQKLSDFFLKIYCRMEVEMFHIEEERRELLKNLEQINKGKK